MRTIKIQLYKFSELSEKAKDKARQWFREGNDYAWSDDAQKSLEGFVNALPIKLRDYSYGERGREYFSWECTDNNVDDLWGLRLRTWIINNFWNGLEKGKFYSTAGTYDANGKYLYKHRYGTTKEVSCPFTGYCADESLIDPIRAFIKSPSATMTFKELVNDCFESFAKSVADDIEYQNSDECIDETIEVNEYEFNKDGEKI